MSEPAPREPRGTVESLQLPHEPEAERAVLGAVLLDAASLLQVLDKVGPEDFYLESHKLVFEGVVGLHERGEAVDVVTLTNHLRESAQLERVGGATYIAGLLDAMPDVANAEHYAGIVRDKALKRRLIGAAQRILSTCSSDSGEASEVVEAAQRDVFRIAEEALAGGLVPVSTLAQAEIEALEKAKETRAAVTGLDTGFVGLNNVTAGLHPKDLIILAARPGMGKTSLALNIAAHAALRQRQKVAVFSLEMAAGQLVRRLLAAEARVDQTRLAGGYTSKGDWSRLVLASQALQDATLWIDDSPGMTVLELSAKARRLKQEHGVDLVVVDYLQLMSGGGRFTSRNEEVSAISRGLKSVAKELDVPLLVLSQLSRQPEHRGGDHRPRLADLRESGSIEQDADVVVFIVRPSVYDDSVDDPRRAELIIAKQRNGPTGEVILVFQSEYTRFENADLVHEEEGMAPPPY